MLYVDYVACRYVAVCEVQAGRQIFLIVMLLAIIFNKCTKQQFMHLLTAAFKDLHVKNSKNHKR